VLGGHAHVWRCPGEQLRVGDAVAVLFVCHKLLQNRKSLCCSASDESQTTPFDEWQSNVLFTTRPANLIVGKLEASEGHRWGGTEKFGAEDAFAASRENVRTVCAKCRPAENAVSPHDLAGLAGAVTTGSKCAFGLVPELDVVREKRILGVFGHQDSFRVRAPQYARLRDNIHRR
jgi:hypothetical protein